MLVVMQFMQNSFLLLIQFSQQLWHLVKNLVKEKAIIVNEDNIKISLIKIQSVKYEYSAYADLEVGMLAKSIDFAEFESEVKYHKILQTITYKENTR